jgi:hypothetical protein
VRPIYRTGTPLPSNHPILCIFSTNIRTEFFKHAKHSPFFSLQNAFHFTMLPFFGSCIICILHTGCSKIEMPNCGVKRLKTCLRFGLGLFAAGAVSVVLRFLYSSKGSRVSAFVCFVSCWWVFAAYFNSSFLFQKLLTQV